MAWVSVARIVDEPFDYLVRWTELTGALVWLTIGWTVLEEVRAVASVPTRRVVGCGRRARGGRDARRSAALTAVRAFDAPPALGEQRAYDRMAARLPTRGPATAGAGRPVADAADLSSAGLGASVLNGLLGAGIDAGVPPEFGWQVAGAHVVARDRAGTRLLVAYGDEGERLRDRSALPRPRRRRRAPARRGVPSWTDCRRRSPASRSRSDGHAGHPALARRLAELAGPLGAWRSCSSSAPDASVRCRRCGRGGCTSWASRRRCCASTTSTHPVAGPGEVVVDVAAASLNFPDVLMCRGEYQVKPPLPFTPGAEVERRGRRARRRRRRRRCSAGG